MADYTLHAAEDDVIVGTSDADVVVGGAGGKDLVTTLGGNDFIDVGREVFTEYTVVDGVEKWKTVDVGGYFRGVIDGGDGVDHLKVGLRNMLDTPRFDVKTYLILNSLRNTTISNVEILEVAHRTELSLEQFNTFSTVIGDAQDVLRLKFIGEGGTLDLRSMAPSVVTAFLDASELTSDVTYYAMPGFDSIAFGSGDDVVYYSGGQGSYSGGEGFDTLIVRWASNSPFIYENGSGNGLSAHSSFELYDIEGGSGNDIIKLGGLNVGKVEGSGGNDFIYTGAGNDTLSGGDGDDTIFGRLLEFAIPSSPNLVMGYDQIYGGAGNDKIYAAQDFVWGGEGNDIVIATFGNNTIDAGDGRDQILTYGADKIFAGKGNDVVSFFGESSVIDGGEGDDLIQAFTSAATPWTGFPEGNELRGGKGDDRYVIDDARDRVVELRSEGVDRVDTFVSYVAPANVEHLTLLGTAGINAMGSNSANVLIGNSGNNILTGRGGLDALEGGGGADTFRYLALSDSNAVTGVDRIVDFDFAQGDRVNVLAIDANAGLAGNQAFDTLIAADAAFTEAGQFRFSKMGNYFLAEFNVNGDPTAELAIRFQGIEPPEETWFIL